MTEDLKYSILALSSEWILSILRHQKAARDTRSLRKKDYRTIGWNWSQARRFRCHSDYCTNSDHIHGVGVFQRRNMGWIYMLVNPLGRGYGRDQYLQERSMMLKSISLKWARQDFRDIVLRALALVTMLPALRFYRLMKDGRASSCWRIQAMWWSLSRNRRRMRMAIWLSQPWCEILRNEISCLGIWNLTDLIWSGPTF